MNVKYIDKEDNTYYTKFTILIDPSLVLIALYLVCLINAYESIEIFFKRNNAFLLYTYDLYGHTLAQEPLPQGS